MSREDYISKLFIKNQDKLSQDPSPDLWAKIEMDLDASPPVATPVKSIGVTRYLMAASVVAVIATVAVWFQFVLPPENTAIAAREIEETKPVSEHTMLLEDDALPINEQEQEALLEEEDKQQTQRILNRMSKGGGSGQSAESQEIQIADKIEKIELEEVATKAEVVSAIASEPTTTTGYNNTLTQEDIKDVQAYNYAAPPTISTQTANQYFEGKTTSNSTAIIEKETNVTPTTTNRRNRLQSKKAVPTDTKKQSDYANFMATANPRLQIFGWMLGNWVDNNESEGTSYEKWQLKDRNTLQGKGYKLSSNQEQMFEELIEIKFVPNLNQVFLNLRIGESQPTIEYMLVSFDNERIVFKQSASKAYPDEVVIQRDLDGFTTILINNKGFLDGEQQRYLSNRNRVSNVRAIRTMTYQE